MAVDAVLSIDSGHFCLDLYPGEPRERVADVPPELADFDPSSTTWVYYDGSALKGRRHEPVGIEVFDAADLTDDDLVMFDRLHFPRMTVRGQNRADVTLVDLLRRARTERWRAEEGGRAGSGWPDARRPLATEASG